MLKDLLDRRCKLQGCFPERVSVRLLQLITRRVVAVSNPFGTNLLDNRDDLVDRPRAMGVRIPYFEPRSRADDHAKGGEQPVCGCDPTAALVRVLASVRLRHCLCH